MSTLKTSNIQDTSGNNNSTPEEIYKGRIKAWIIFDGADASIGTGDASFNVSSVTDNGTGNYTINFTDSFPDTNYIHLSGPYRNDATQVARIPTYAGSDTKSTSAFQVRHIATTVNTSYDYYVNIAFIG